MKKYGVAALIGMLFSPNIFACLPDVKRSLDMAVEYTKKMELRGDNFDDIWYNSLNKNEDLIPDIIIAYGQAGCWEEAINIAKSIQNKNSEQQNKKYAYAISNLAIIKAFNGDYDAAKNMLGELKYQSQKSNNNYGTLTIAEIMAKHKSLADALALIKSNRYIDKSSYTNILENLLSTGQIDLARTESKNTSNIEILFPYIKYLSEHGKKSEAYNILEKAYDDLTEKDRCYWGTVLIAMSYARFDDIEKIHNISNKINEDDKLLILALSVPHIQSKNSKIELEQNIQENFIKLTQEKKIRYLNQIAESYSLVGDLREFVSLIKKISSDIDNRFQIQLAAISFIETAIYKGNLPLAKKSSEILLPYMTKTSMDDYYIMQSFIATEESNFNKAYESAKNITLSSPQPFIYASSKNIDFKLLYDWYNYSINNKQCTPISCVQVLSARAASLNTHFDPIELLKTEEPAIIARSWFGYAQGKMKITPGKEYILNPIILGSSYSNEKLLYQLYK